MFFLSILFHRDECAADITFLILHGQNVLICRQIISCKTK